MQSQINICEPSKISYKKIKLQDLEERTQIRPIELTHREIILKMNKSYNWISKPCLHYEDSGIGTSRIIPNNGLFRVNSFFHAFLNAYTQHGDIALVPDEVWIMITFFISTYIDQHAEKLSSKLVRHEGVKTLTVVEIAGSQEESVEMEKKWDNFFDQILKKIEENTQNDIADSFACNFSTTNKTYKIISTAVAMNSLQKLFNYRRRICACGINNIHMAGTREDWVSMIPKLEKMIQFDVDGKLKQYISHMQTILSKFVQTFDEKPDLQWWNCVFKSYEAQRVYGGQQVEVDGWILHFFGVYQPKNFHGFPELAIKVPIKMVNEITKTQKQLKLVADFCSISKLDERTYKPDVGFCIFEMSKSQ